MCTFNLTVTARYWCLVHIPVAYVTLHAIHVIKFEQEPVLSYESRTMILNPKSGICVVAYTERVLWLCAAVLIAVYAGDQLWYVTPDLFAFSRELGVGMPVALGSRATLSEYLELFEIIE